MGGIGDVIDDVIDVVEDVIEDVIDVVVDVVEVDLAVPGGEGGHVDPPGVARLGQLVT